MLDFAAFFPVIMRSSVSDLRPFDGTHLGCQNTTIIHQHLYLILSFHKIPYAQAPLLQLTLNASLQRPVFPVKSLYLDPPVSDQLS